MKLCVRIFVLTCFVSLTFCTKKKSETAPHPVLIKGRFAVPAEIDRFTVFQDGKAKGADNWQRYSCPKDQNQSGISGSVFILHTQNNCAVAEQYVYFEKSTPQDLSHFANGYLSIKLQVDNNQQALKVVFQDSDAKTSPTIDLADYGFDPQKTALMQLIKVPVSDINKNDINLSEMKRVFQLIASCTTSNCLTQISNVTWNASSEKATAQLVSENLSANLTFPDKGYCYGVRPCRPMKKSPIRFVKITSQHWTAEPTTVGYTNDLGEAGFYINSDVIPSLTENGKYPLFLGGTDSLNDYTLLTILDAAKIAEETTVEVQVDLTTTVSAVSHCPGAGVSGAYCATRGDDASLSTFEDSINKYFESTQPNLDTSESIDDLISQMADDGDFLAAMQQYLQTRGIDDVTKDSFQSQVSSNELPTITLAAAASTTGKTTLPGFPETITPGNYLMTARVCVTGASCQDLPSKTFTVDDPTKFEAEFKSAVESSAQSCSGAVGDATKCSVSFTPFNGSSFTATVSATSCDSEGTCATANVTYTFTRQ